MLPNFAENRKPHQREGSPVIHQGMTVQLFVPILRARVTVQGGFLPCLPSPPPPSPLARLGLCLITSGGGVARLCWGQVFIYLSRLFGVGRLKNVECCNWGGGWRSRTWLSCSMLPFRSCTCGGSWLPSTPQSSDKAQLSIPEAPGGLAPWSWPHLPPWL